MCGIAGIYAYRDAGAKVDLSELRSMRDHMQRRGPDASGDWLSADQRVGLAHRRLAIIDLSDRGAQPMHTRDERLHITFNGEIYNYRALRGELERKGVRFESHSDTEVLLHLYRERGADMLHALRGMYAFALWDAAERCMLLARDPYGIKPLYYSTHAGCLRFASQVKAILAGGRVPRTPDSAGSVGFHLWGFVPEPFTSCATISALPAGTSLTVNEHGVQPLRRHFSIAYALQRACEDPAADSSDVQALVQRAVRESVAAHMIADVPVSAFLSAGIDSGALAGLMSEQGSSIHAITLAFTEFMGTLDDEAVDATEVARHYGLIHRVRRVDEAEFQRDLPAILDAMDQPTIDGLNTWFVSKATAELGLKVAVSGVGGDELFGGYPSFQQVPRLARLLAIARSAPGLGRATRKLLAPVIDKLPYVHPKVAGTLEYGSSVTGAYWLKRGLFMPWELSSVLPEDWVHDGLARLAPEAQLHALLDPTPREPWAQVAALEASSYMRNQLLRDTDWASMAHSLEVRTPLVDHVLLTKLMAAIVHDDHTRSSKHWLASSPRKRLPQRLLQRKKTGFRTPIDRWLQHATALDVWRSRPALRAARCPWARRYACAIASIQTPLA
jgi:asparagine synthase (glutamine-hydrolysing)